MKNNIIQQRWNPMTCVNMCSKQHLLYVFLFCIFCYIIVPILGMECKEYSADELLANHIIFDHPMRRIKIPARFYNLKTKHSKYYNAKTGKFLTRSPKKLIQKRVNEYKSSHQPSVKACWSQRVISSNLTKILLEEVTSLTIRGLIWPTMPESFSAENVELIDVTPRGVWGGCSKLKYLDIKNINTTLMSPDWLTNCTNLRDLNMMDVSVKQIYTVLESASRVQSLHIYGINDARNVLKYVSSFKNRKILKWLTRITILNFDEIDVEGENTTWAEVSALLSRQLAALPRLQNLEISLKNFDFCTPANNFSLTFPSLKVLDLSYTSPFQACFRNLRIMPKLEEIHMHNSPNNDIVEIRELYYKPGPSFRLSVWADHLIFSRDDYLDLINDGGQKGNITLMGPSIPVKFICDCIGSLWLARAIQMGLVNSHQLEMKCYDGKKFADHQCEQMKCNKIACPGRCVCCRDEARNGVFADCRGANLTTFPIELLSINNLTELLAPNNSITSLPDGLKLPHSLQLLDLSDNRIWKLGAGAVSTLFRNPQLRIRMSGNMINCLCDNKPLIEALQNDPHNQIIDKDGIVCVQNKTKIRDVKVSELCDERDREQALNKQRELYLIAAVVATVVIAVIALALIVGYYYRRQLQIFLYARGWCLCCIQGDKLDAERYYDVFLSFCHEDTEFVLNQLLPPLDQEYSVCVHLRDWCPGGMIPSQIAISVEQSRRTIVVVSKNFLKSLWGMLEFRTAYASSLEERRVRVVMVVLDDALDAPDLAADLRAYVRLNTYLQWDDPWFWQKLRFALPHHPSPRTPFSPKENHLPDAPPSPQEILSLPAPSPPHIPPAPSTSLSVNA